MQGGSVLGRAIVSALEILAQFVPCGPDVFRLEDPLVAGLSQLIEEFPASHIAFVSKHRIEEVFLEVLDYVVENLAVRFRVVAGHIGRS